ncbi:protein phosphatase 1 regulatory subunit 14A-like isoform X2 [Echeneis naucrates]|uniref:protein phosphatase 1 regulatory subunit 14A-like isoform X2 n=1 Tax=Echeneis naucrates TaxID=173247 RepID=UPI00111356DD|nr:protein phosphatase 1 regulatory subunit 14A-like isoform X2 [Echeneis naucrates]XP_029372920.1 protein phosphatase 1 regulatory subunit 14A-like isoform X2 [Echeneis naucrates]
MAANRVGRRVNKACNDQSQSRAGGGRDPSLRRRQARITVKYNRKELQRRLDVEKWIDCGLDELYRGRRQSGLAQCMTTVFRASSIYKRVSQGEFSGVLLGDKGCACESFLLTPLADTKPPPQQAYNHAHGKTRT